MVGLCRDEGKGGGRAVFSPRASVCFTRAVLLAAAITASAGNVLAEPRFGDSTWVAPAAPDSTGDPSASGPRVAPPDHEPGWEKGLRAPFRVVFYPLRLVARGFETGGGIAANHFLGDHGPKKPKQLRVSLRVDPSGLLDGDINDIGIGPAFTLLDVPVPGTIIDTNGSWTLSGRRQARFVGLYTDRPIGFILHGDYDYKPDRKFYGIGNDSKAEDKSYYLLENTRVEAGLLLGKFPLRQLRVVAGISSLSPRRGANTSPHLGEVFDEAEVPFAVAETQELLAGITADYAWLNDDRDPSLGVHGRTEMRHYFGSGDGDPDYHQWLFEGRGYVPVFASRRVIAVRGVYAGVEPTEDADVMPFYRLTTSEGSYRFAGFPSQRFRDRQLVLGRIEYRWAIWRRLNATALYEIGEVALNWDHFQARDVHISYGGGLRLNLSPISAFRLDIAHSVEGLNVVLRFGSTL